MKEKLVQDTPENDLSDHETQAGVKHYTRLQAVFETSLIIVGLIAMFRLLPRSLYGDGIVRFQAISDLIEHGKLSDMSYSIVGPAFSIPLWLLGYVYQTPTWWCEQYNLFVFTCGLLVTYWLVKDCIDRSLLRKFFLILIACSMFANHIIGYYGEAFTAICVGVGILAVATGRSWGGWVAVILGVVNIPASMVGLGGIILKHMLESKHWRYILVIGVAAGLIVAESWLRRGGPFISGYEGNGAYTTTTVMPYTGKPGFSYPFFFGLLSILFSFGKGLLFFAPGLLLPIRRTILNMREEKKLVLYRAYILWMCFLIGLILVYSRWWAWYGGWFWGPRFFLFASIPASFALAVRLHYRDTSLTLNLLTGIILCLSTWVGIDGAVFGQNLLTGVCLVHNYALETLCHYTPEFSALWHPFVVGEHLDRRQIMYEVYSVLVFAYLAIPLLWEVGSQTIELAGNFGRAHLNFKSWLF